MTRMILFHLSSEKKRTKKRVKKYSQVALQEGHFLLEVVKMTGPVGALLTFQAA